jgi:hypothetical protein
MQMIIDNLDYIEEITEVSGVEGGTNDWSSILQSLQIYPAASASVINLGGESIGNTAVAMNITMPVFITIMSPSSNRNSRIDGWSGIKRHGKSRW